MKRFLLALLFASADPRWVVADDRNPIGVTGAFEGVITTGGAYNVLNHNARRQIDDIVVPGSIGKYPLKMTRYYNSRRAPGYGSMGPGWTHEYSWSYSFSTGKTNYPNGSELDSGCFEVLGVSDYWQTLNCTTGCVGDFRLADGGTVHFDSSNGYFQVRRIEDPYGQTTTLAYDASGFLSRVTEPGGRYLLFTYNGPQGRLSRVEAHGLGNATVTDWVNYSYTSVSPGGNGASQYCLTGVAYSDNTSAIYSYTQDNAPDHPGPPCPCSLKLWPLLQTCRDVRYKGAMRQICYEYQPNGPHGAIIAERYSLNGSTNGPRVSWIDPPAPSPIIADANFDTAYTEHRGDGPTRTFNYTELHIHRFSDDSCPNRTFGPADQQFLLNYTDFQGNTTYLGYDTNRYVNSVRDANNHTTSYVHGSPPPAGIGEILTITHPGGSHIDYTYYDAGHYLRQITNERGAITYHFRDGNHRITRTDYKDANGNLLANETFTYDNSFGQVLTHRLKNGAYVHFKYDANNRGLLVAKTNPTTIADWQTAINGAPKTTYTYYVAADGKPGWIDRVKTMTLPANASGFSASETYEYDLSPNNTSRGLVTKIQHADGKYQSFFYDAYGNKLWEENELRNRTTYTYDDYNRVLTVKNPLNKTETFDYLKTGTSSTYVHTTNSVYAHTSRAGIVTTNVYDQNWRKTSIVVASGTLNLTTRFAYDNVGNLTDVTDPRIKVTHHGYDPRNRKTSTTEAYGTNIAATTVWHYDPASNINQIDRPDGIHETKGYDALNRMIWHSVPRQVPGPSPAPTPINLTTRIEYDPSGTIDHVTDARGKVTSFQYNASDEKTQMTYHDGSYQQWSWDNAHNLASRTTVRGGNEIQRFFYDNCNRRTDMSWDNSADWAHFTYYDDSRLRQAQNANSTITRQYDAAGHLAWEQQTVSGLGSTKTVNYPSYDDDGRLTNVNVGGASYDYTYSYDAAGRFWKIFATGNLNNALFEYQYDAASNETDRYAYLPNSVSIQQHYYRDSLNRMGSRLVKKNGATFSTESYTYSRMNRITDVNRGGVADSFAYYWDGELEWATYAGGPHFPYTEGQDPDLDTSDPVDANAGYQPPTQEDPEPASPPDDYSDPPVGQLIPPDYPTGRAVGYYLDKAGNRQQMTDTANPTVTYVINNINQYTSVSGCSISNGLEHEVSSFAGPNHPGAVTYTYVNDEHLKQVTDINGNTYYLYYDALGRCVKRNRNNNNALTTYYIYDGEKPLLEYSSTGVVGRNLYGKGIDEILMRTNPGVNDGYAVYYAHDHEGSVTHLLDGRNTPRSQTGNVIERYTYDAFGAPTFLDASGNPLNPNCTAYNNRFLFTGREYGATYRGFYVPSFQFYEYRARAYNPILGRFMSEDPKLFDGGDYNLFRYCHNDPVDFTDPMGLDDTAPTYSPRQTSQERAETLSATQAVWERQMKFSSSHGAITEGWSHMLANLRKWAHSHKDSDPDFKHMKTVCPTIVAVAPIEEAPAAIAGLSRLISRMLRASGEETTSTALSTIRFTHSGETFYRYESGSPAFSRVTSSGGVTPETFAAPTSDGLLPIRLRASTYKLPDPHIARPTVITLRPSPGTAVIGPRSVVGGTGNEVFFPFGY